EPAVEVRAVEAAEVAQADVGRVDVEQAVVPADGLVRVVARQPRAAVGGPADDAGRALVEHEPRAGQRTPGDGELGLGGPGWAPGDAWGGPAGPPTHRRSRDRLLVLALRCVGLQRAHTQFAHLQADALQCQLDLLEARRGRGLGLPRLLAAHAQVVTSH